MTKKGCIKHRHAKKNKIHVEPYLEPEQKPSKLRTVSNYPYTRSETKKSIGSSQYCTYLPRYLEGLPVAATATLNGLEWNLIFLSFLVKNINCHEHRRSNIKGTS